MLLYMTNNPTSLGASMVFTLETTNMFVALDLNVNLSLKKTRGKICYNRCLAKTNCAVPHTTRFG
jgi:hypothetical protein